MSLTYIDCHFYRSAAATIDSSYVAVNPSLTPGSLLVGVAAPARGSIGGQVASKLSLQHFVEGIFANTGLPENEERSVKFLESGFRNANSSVYSFGHKLAAGGRMAASLLGLVIEDTLAAAGRVGDGSVYLYRAGELFPFFQPTGKNTSGTQVFVGSNSVVSVEIASVPVEENDRVLMFSTFLDPLHEEELLALLRSIDLREGNPCIEICERLYGDPKELTFGMLARIGPDAIYLGQPLVLNR